MAIRLETVVIALGLAIMAGLMFAFISISDGVNQDPSELRAAAERRAEARDNSAGRRHRRSFSRS